MLDMDRLWAADWDGLFRFFAAGNPPLMLQLLAVNTIFFIAFLVRNATAKHRVANKSAPIVQSFLIAANVALVFQGDAFKWIGRLI